MMVGRCWSNPVLLQSLRRKTHSCAAEPSSYAYIVSLSLPHTHIHTRIHTHTYTHTYTHMYTHKGTYVYTDKAPTSPAAAARSCIDVPLWDYNHISPSYTSHHGRHHMLTKDILLHIDSYIRYIASPGKDKYIWNWWNQTKANPLKTPCVGNRNRGTI